MVKSGALLAGGLLALVTPSLAQEPVFLTPERLGEIFCIARLANDMPAAAGLLTDDLQAAIAVAEATNAAIAAQAPDDKPPLGDGVPWASVPDHPDRCVPGDPQWQMDEARLDITYTFESAPDAGFTDTLMLSLVEQPDRPSAWRIDNVIYGTGDSLRTVLLGAFMD